jgi:hypothetical protein
MAGYARPRLVLGLVAAASSVALTTLLLYPLCAV